MNFHCFDSKAFSPQWPHLSIRLNLFPQRGQRNCFPRTPPMKVNSNETPKAIPKPAPSQCNSPTTRRNTKATRTMHSPICIGKKKFRRRRRKSSHAASYSSGTVLIPASWLWIDLSRELVDCKSSWFNGQEDLASRRPPPASWHAHPPRSTCSGRWGVFRRQL